MTTTERSARPALIDATALMIAAAAVYTVLAWGLPDRTLPEQTMCFAAGAC